LPSTREPIVSTVAIILAADAGQDFTTTKYLVPVHGRSMLAQAIESCLKWDVDERVVVLGSDAETVAETIDDPSLTVLIDPEWSEGASSPIRAALDLVTRDRSVERCVLARADDLDVRPEIVNELLSTAMASDADVVVPKYRYARGWPVVIGPHMWGHLLGQEGDIDLLDAVSLHAISVDEVWFDQIAPVQMETSDAVANEVR
jgi:CTP:molybdopterin cytidylyltransferase MocA